MTACCFSSKRDQHSSSFLWGSVSDTASSFSEKIWDILSDRITNLDTLDPNAAELVRNLPDDLSRERREVIKTACSLVGKVCYYWGGKSLVIGWDDHWGVPQKV